ncbi:MAG: hypothetical protein IPQ07_17980 [Myxococcales bacterium]|nr:hypothetical protein [Myxococcales bacterium]
MSHGPSSSTGRTAIRTNCSCNPLTQTGCNEGEKCNWIYDQLMPTLVGHIGCEPAGTVAAVVLADPCARC